VKIKPPSGCFEKYATSLFEKSADECHDSQPHSAIAQSEVFVHGLWGFGRCSQCIWIFLFLWFMSVWFDLGQGLHLQLLAGITDKSVGPNKFLEQFLWHLPTLELSDIVNI